MTKQQILLSAKQKFPGKNVRVCTIGGITELLVGEPRKPKESFAIPKQRERYSIQCDQDDCIFTKKE